MVELQGSRDDKQVQPLSEENVGLGSVAVDQGGFLVIQAYVHGGNCAGLGKEIGDVLVMDGMNIGL